MLLKTAYRYLAGLLVMLLIATGLAACGSDGPAATGAALNSPEPATPSNKNPGTDADLSNMLKEPVTPFGPDPTATPNTAVSDKAAVYEGVITFAPTARPSPSLAPTATRAPATAAPTATPAYPTPALKLPPAGPLKKVQFKGKGTVGEGQFRSNLLQKEATYRVYLPREYADRPEKRYPALYMLHGFSGKVDEWEWYGLLQRMDDLVETGSIRPFLIVLVMGEQAYWVDHPNDGPRWGEYVAREVVDHIDGNFRTLPLKESRGIGGLSMGAAGALQISMSYPNVFGVVGAHSPSLRTYEQRLPWWGDQAWYARYDPVTQARTSAYLPQVKLWVDIGLDDSAWRERALEFKSVLESRKLTFKWTDFPGDHNGEYWTAHTLDYLNWYGTALAGPQV